MTVIPPTQGLEPPKVTSRQAARLMLLDCIRRVGEIARIDISAAIGVSPATVTAVTAELLDAGLIEPILSAPQASAAKRGRPRASLRIRGAARLIAGLKVGRRAITVLLTDFRGDALGALDHPISDSRHSAADLVAEIVMALQAACASSGMAPDQIDVVSIGLAGHIDGAAGHVHWSSALRERNVDLAQLLGRRLACPVFIENDANLVAKAEQLFGEGRAFQSFIVVTLEHGIGMGIVINGALYRGARGCGAEFGHTKVSLDGALCQCGQHGCLEAYAGEYALLGNQTMGGTPPYPDLATLSAAAQAGDPAASETLARAGRFFAMGLANIINVFDPELLILAIKDTGPHPLCQPHVLEQVSDMVVQVDAPLPKMVVHGWGDLIWAKGAAAFGIEKISERVSTELGRTGAQDRSSQ